MNSQHIRKINYIKKLSIRKFYSKLKNKNLFNPFPHPESRRQFILFQMFSWSSNLLPLLQVLLLLLLTSGTQPLAINQSITSSTLINKSKLINHQVTGKTYSHTMEIQIAKPIHDTFIVIVSTLNYSIIGPLKVSGRQCMMVKLNSIVDKFFRIHLRRIFIEFERKVDVQNHDFRIFFFNY